MASSKRSFSSDLKARVALEAIRGVKSVSELAGEYQVHPTQVAAWKKQLLAAAPGVFNGRAERQAVDQGQLVDRLYQQIGQLKVELDWLSKKSGVGI
jgi:transposase-like protein